MPTFLPTTYVPTFAPTLAPSVGPSFAPTNTPAPTYYPSVIPTNSPTVAPSMLPTMFPTPTDLSPAQLALHRERADQAQAKAQAKVDKQQAIHKRVVKIREEKDARKQQLAMNLQAAVDTKRSALFKDMQTLAHYQKSCKFKNMTLPEEELKVALERVRLPPAAIAAALHKVAILRSVRNAMVKLKAMEQLNTAHSMFALKKAGAQLIDATKEIQEKSAATQPSELHMSKNIVPT